MKKLLTYVVAPVVLIIVGVKFASSLRPQFARIPLVGKLFA